MAVRHPQAGELHSLDILKEFHALPLEKEWIWLAEQAGQVVGMTMACSMHGILFLMRMIVLPDAPVTTSLALIRQMGKDAKVRGCIGFMCLIDPNRPTEVKLGKFFQKLPDAKFVPYRGVIATGRIDGRLFK